MLAEFIKKKNLIETNHMSQNQLVFYPNCSRIDVYPLFVLSQLLSEETRCSNSASPQLNLEQFDSKPLFKVQLNVETQSYPFKSMASIIPSLLAFYGVSLSKENYKVLLRIAKAHRVFILSGAGSTISGLKTFLEKTHEAHELLSNPVIFEFFSACFIDVFRFFEDAQRLIVTNEEILATFIKTKMKSRAWEIFIENSFFEMDSVSGAVPSIYKELAKGYQCDQSLFMMHSHVTSAYFYHPSMEHTVHIPMTASPNLVLRKDWDDLLAVQKAYCKLHWGLSRNTKVMTEIIEKHPDKMMASLVELQSKIKPKTQSKNLELFILRNDFMLSREEEWKQVEINLFAAGMEVCTDYVTKFHRSFLPNLQPRLRIPFPDDINDKKVFKKGMSAAYKLYNEAYSPQK